MDEIHHPAATTTPPRSPAFDINHTPSISPLSTTSRTAIPPIINPIPLQLETTDQVDHVDQSDGSSSLSDYDAEFDNQSPRDNNDRDSEAETERLERSPIKSWIPSPTKLNQASVRSEPASSPDPQPQSPSPTQARLGTHIDVDGQLNADAPFAASPLAIAGRKRKRPSPISDADSPLSEHSDSEEALALNHNRHIDQAPESRQETPEPADEVDENPYISPMKAARLKRAKQKKQTRDPSPAVQIAGNELEEEEADEQNDGDEETKKRATEAFTAIVEQFQTFRTKMHDERLASAEAELEQLNLPNATHPDFLAMLQCITARRDTKIQQEFTLHRYKLGTLRNQVLAERAQLHTQYFQEARELRDSLLEQLGKQWYDIQKERRQFQADQQDNYSYKFPTKRSDQVRNQEKYNREVSILSGMAKYRGFPAAPDIHGARTNELDDDFKAMQIPRRQALPQQQAPAQQNSVHMHSAPASVRTAEERFIEQTPWANPQHPLHHQSRTPGPFGTYGMHLQPNLMRQGSAQGQRTTSPFSTPLPNPAKRAEYPQNGLGSNDTIGIPSDPPSSAVPQTGDRFAQGPVGGDISPTDQLKVRSALANPLANRADRRDFSGLSSASTIETPSDPADMDRHGVPSHTSAAHNGLPIQLPVEHSAPQQAFVTSALHTQNGKPEDRKPELYENINYRRPQLGAFGTPMPLFGTNSPAHPDGQKAS
ncbi:hypothetical protein D6D10_04906 [Aureobasidium pullulans]|uniref:Transcriptional regulatory protein DEP1 n=1 Tax=Aureobasidium pullulans TaxID=5580 RepID=A0A4S9EXZ2_AURPU|nr:hypothetical protein D6D10_04906 [Aureobasidium pullulans]